MRTGRRPPRPIDRLALVLAVVLALIATGGAAVRAEEEGAAVDAAELDRLRTRIETTRHELAELADQERDAARELQHLQREISLVQELLAGLDRQEQDLAARRDSLQARLAVRQADHEQRRETLARRLRALYMRGPQNDLEQILTSGSFSALVARLRYGAMVARVDGDLVEHTRAQAAAIAAERQELQVALTGIWEAREEAQAERARLAEARQEREALRQALGREKSQTEGQLRELEAREQRLQELLARLEERRQDAAPPVPGAEAGPSREGRLVGRRGDLAWPVAGEVTGTFGRHVHPEYRTVTQRNGITIAATSGAPVYAVAPGTVEFAEHLPGFGLCVILDHGAGQYTLYANLARVFVSAGREISGGQILAELGRGQGTARPELYFEVRQGRDPQDPLLWLRDRP